MWDSTACQSASDCRKAACAQWFPSATSRQIATSPVIDFGSGAGLNGQPNQASYAAAKEAIR
ncbi:hypothetical protein ACFW5I_20880 [Streptomyces sp. NPDC058818]|uniref:hypothetical protein n=1 Tax=Streptomyces sp. NPDC058818 TaxID=3346640 RepID=UPI0036BEA539